jgi:hypothetical protein
MKKDKLGRRDFLKKTGAAALAFTIIPRHVLGGEGYTVPSDQLTKVEWDEDILHTKVRAFLQFAM